MNDNPASILFDINGNPLKVRTESVLQTDEWEEDTFYILAAAVDIGNNKSMVSILNALGSPVVLRIHELYIRNVRTAAATGVASIFELHRFTAATAAHSGGTVITPQALDTDDIVDANVSVRTGATTITTELSPILERWLWSSDDWGPGTLDQEGLEHSFQNVGAAYNRFSKTKPLTLRANQGITIKHVVNSTAGTFDLRLTVSQV